MNENEATEELSLSLPKKARSLAISLRVLLYMLRGLRIGSLDVRLPNGEQRSFRGSEPGPHGQLVIHDAALVRHVLQGGEVGFGDAYLAGCWDSPDLTRLLMVLYRNEPYFKGPFEFNALGRLYGWIQHQRRANTRRGSKANIEYHYDLGNAFYELWLDETMAYSSAVFDAPEQSLRDASRNKFRLMAERLQLERGHHLLEIGSGWGGFAIYAAQHYGCTVHSITLSNEQLAEAQRRAQAAGVADRVRFEIRDYRDVHEQYDRVVSIEMYEAVGERYWPGYFKAIEQALKPGGRAAIQGITIDEAIFDQYRNKRDFIQKYIFPGGMLCTPTLFQQLASRAGLVPENARFHALDYAETLAHWHRNVLAVREQVVQQFDERFLRMWRYYLAYCECGFRTGSCDLMQIDLVKPR
ncbi:MULTISPECIES: cyclopropane-fatty-acyl-phospholipid synthase family protein [Hydrocarboniphaga]|uniref:cyclopropane-fatty-acyl-phospholipid synthase family protein n=3 Tax=Nevskiaceae TaxID=568386 RepID=UPI002ABC15C6|nr:cyclopropane-fatty-acyl-phospholipid synthase family protein [Hydrocarboniphaga sp.]MDZ4079288.1 cyclopropane-fatty-acyl-phospholipid synthase family protein [Hydrocarboniphaga sp.]